MLRGDEIEAEARAMLRELIERTPWFKIRMTWEQRREAIEREVDEHWHLYALDAPKRLGERAACKPRSETLESSQPRRYRVRARRRSG
jgi:hypothetical protein